MGYPVGTIETYEWHLKQRARSWSIIILANANSDSKATEFIIRNFHEMDVTSDNVDFFLPGYDVGDISATNRSASRSYNEESLSGLQSVIQSENQDFHNKIASLSVLNRSLFFRRQINFDSRYFNIIDSPRLGSILFKEVEFADFVLEITRRKKGYMYMGTCQMLIIPVKQGCPIYSELSVYDLDKVINSPCGGSLDFFLHHTFNILRHDIYNQPTGARRILNKLIGITPRKNTINEIDKLYKESTDIVRQDDSYVINIYNQVIIDMEHCLQWSLDEEFYFISYSSKDTMKAETLKRAMQDKGLHVWIAPDGIPQGREYSLIIPTALKLSKHFVLLLTPNSAQSRWVKRELDIAISNEENTKVKVLFADGYTIDDLRRDDELSFYLNRVQIKYEYSDVVRDEKIFNWFTK